MRARKLKPSRQRITADYCGTQERGGHVRLFSVQRSVYEFWRSYCVRLIA
jgi:hypothetical protein